MDCQEPRSSTNLDVSGVKPLIEVLEERMIGPRLFRFAIQLPVECAQLRDE
jgi:hypothetical protein